METVTLPAPHDPRHGHDERDRTGDGAAARDARGRASSWVSATSNGEKRSPDASGTRAGRPSARPASQNDAGPGAIIADAGRSAAVAYLLWEQMVAGSIPAAPTKFQ